MNASLRLALALLLLAGCTETTRDPNLPVVPPELEADIDKLRPLAHGLPPPSPQSWRAQNPEPSESLEEWCDRHPPLATPERRLIEVQPVGVFSPGQQEVTRLAAEHLGLFYSLPCKVLPPLAAPDATVRRRRSDGRTQLLVSDLLRVTRPSAPDKTIAFLVLTTDGLWPGGAWSHVFGASSPGLHEGACSLARFGNPDESPEARRLCLCRALKVTTHECGHIFAIHHCVMARCGMNGSATLKEHDEHTLFFCPDCLTKMATAAHFRPEPRFRALRDWYRTHDLSAEAAYCDAVLEALAKPAAPATR